MVLRVHSLQRGGSITYPGRIKLGFTGSMLLDSTCPSLQYLAFLFDFIDGSIINCWNGYCQREKCVSWTRNTAVTLLARLKGSFTEVFGGNLELDNMSASQRSDLLVTWQWLRNRLWRLSAGHGLVSEDGPQELSINYVVDVAATTVNMCRQFPMSAMEAHGAGFVSPPCYMEVPISA